MDESTDHTAVVDWVRCATGSASAAVALLGTLRLLGFERAGGRDHENNSRVAHALSGSVDGAISVGAISVASSFALNEKLAFAERAFLSTTGLPGRIWFKHVLQAPGLYTGYAPKTLPGVYDAVSDGDFAIANAQAKVAAARIMAAAKVLRGAD